MQPLFCLAALVFLGVGAHRVGASDDVVLETHFNFGLGCTANDLAQSQPAEACLGNGQTPAVDCRRDAAECDSGQRFVSDLVRREAGGCTFHTFLWRCSDIYRVPCGPLATCDVLARCVNATRGLCECYNNMTVAVGPNVCRCAANFHVRLGPDPEDAICVGNTPCPPGHTETHVPTRTADRVCERVKDDGISTLTIVYIVLGGLFGLGLVFLTYVFYRAGSCGGMRVSPA